MKLLLIIAESIKNFQSPPCNDISSGVNREQIGAERQWVLAGEQRRRSWIGL